MGGLSAAACRHPPPSAATHRLLHTLVQAAEEELHKAEDLVGYALDEAAVDVPAGLDMLHAMFARCGNGAHRHSQHT